MSETKTPGFREIANQLGSGVVTIAEGWRQGRTAYGGMTAGLLMAAIARDFPDLPPLRSSQISFVGPVDASPVFKTRLLRKGRNVVTIEAKVLSGDNVCGAAICMFGAAREFDRSQQLPAPSLPNPEDCVPLIRGKALQFTPLFVRQFETLLVEGAPPMSGAKAPYIRCWSRHADPESRTGIDSFICLGDVLPPAAMATYKSVKAVSSMNWQLNILVDDVTSEDGWYQIETRQSAAEGGYSSQIMRFWNRKGDLIAEGLQSVAIFI
ncbi:MAG: thioesterase family protein [Hellea sp.]|nr:thioesterase family protein [Hellea sp.]